MTNSELIDMLIEHAKEYAIGVTESIKRNNHMNNLRNNVIIEQETADALIVDFVNFIGGKHCMDVGLYTKDLKRKTL